MRHRQPLPMSLALTLSALVAASLLVYGGEDPAAAAPPGVKPAGGEVVVGEDQEPATLNPFMPAGDDFIVTKIGQAYFCGVQEVDGNTLELIPDVVVRLPSVANGGLRVNADGTMTVQYAIRPEARWADGVPVSGSDFEFTYDTIMNPDLPIDRTLYADIIPSSVAAGAKTFEYRLQAPTAQAELLFDTLIPKHAVEGTDFANAFTNAPWLSCGPFEFDSWKKGDRLTVNRNDRYWRRDPDTNQPLPHLDRVVFRFFPEVASLVDAFTARQVDIINPPPDDATLDALEALEPAGAYVDVAPGPIWEHLNFQFGPNRLTRNPNSMNHHLLFRQAVAHAVDRAKVAAELTGGRSTAVNSYVEAFAPELSQGAWAQYFHDSATARAKVAQLCGQVNCGPSGRPEVVFTTTSNNDARVRLSQLLGPMLADGGMDYEAQLEDSSLFFGETLDFGRWDVGEWAWVGAPGLAGLVTIHDVFDPESPPPNGQNFYRWGTPAVSGLDPPGFNQGPSSVIDTHTARFSALRDLANSTVDDAELIPYLQEMERILADQAVIVPLYQRLDPAAVWADEVGGFVHNPSQAGDTWNVAEWYRLPPPESAQAALPAGGSLTTDTESDGATPTDPIETTVTTPNAGTVTIAESSNAAPDPAGFAFLQFAVAITAPPASVADPLRIVLRVDGSLLPDGVAGDELRPTKDGVPVANCTGAGADPDPCLRTVVADTFAEYTILSSTASTWRVGRSVPVPHDVGLVDPAQGRWYLADGTPPFFFGDPGDLPMLGDWDCDGVETPGLYRQTDGFVYLRNSNTSGIAHIRFFFGDPGDVPLAGDFDGDGCDTVSIYRPGESTVYVINELGQNEGGLGAADHAYTFGNPGDKPFVGDFDGDGIDTVGLHRESTGLVYFRNRQTTGIADSQFIYGDPNDRLVAGDWNGDGADSPAIFRPADSRFYQRFTNTAGVADRVFRFGEGSWLPVAGDLTP